MRYTLPQRATRHALLSEGAHGPAGSSPVRRGIAVAAVVGGALSVAGAAVAVDRIPFAGDTVDDDLASIGLAADGQDDKTTTTDAAADDEVETANDEPATTASPVLDTSALADTVRKANEQGKRLADEQKSDNSDAASTAPAPAPAPAVPALAGAGRTASTSPGELIDTNDWYLTLPTGKEGSPDTVEGSKLATYHSKYFDLTPARNGIVFNAGADGVTTKNSHYPRSELREMNGTEKASWSNTTGTHVFDVREAFTKLPEAKPDVVGAQIHDAEDDVMQIRLEGKKLIRPVPRRQVRGCPRPELPARDAVPTPGSSPRTARSTCSTTARRRRSCRCRIRLVLEGRRVRAVERQQGRRGQLGG